MALTEFQKLFRSTLLTLTDDTMKIYYAYKFARTDEIRQEIIDGVLSGNVKNMHDVSKITLKTSPLYKAGLISDNFLDDNDDIDE